MYACLQCKLCHTIPIKPPVMMADCCKIIIGCGNCVDRLYVSRHVDVPCLMCKSSCPHSNYLRINGIDELLNVLSDIKS